LPQARLPLDSVGLFAQVIAASAVAPVTSQSGIRLDANNACVVGTVYSLTQSGFPLDANGNLITVDKASLVTPTTVQNGFKLDANKALVTVANASATTPLVYVSGLPFDQSGALVHA